VAIKYVPVDFPEDVLNAKHINYSTMFSPGVGSAPTGLICAGSRSRHAQRPKLHHTNIAPVFDFGEQDGICYYAMQYITGVALDHGLDDVRRLRAGSGRATEAGTASTGDGQAPFPDRGPPSAATEGLPTGRFAAAVAQSDEKRAFSSR
jgi:hypothetical protein